MRTCIPGLGAAMLALLAAACGGYDSPSTPDSSPPSAAVTIDIVGINGAQSFSPNPATLPAGQTVVWHNRDSTTHRVVLNDGQLDTGNIAPGGFSAPTTLRAPVPYHCSIHPEMVGRIDASTSTTAGSPATASGDGGGNGDYEPPLEGAAYGSANRYKPVNSSKASGGSGE